MKIEMLELRNWAPIVALLFLALDARAGAFEPPTGPGESQGSVEAHWLAPFVLKTAYSVGQHAEITFCWYDEEGNLIERLTGPHVFYNPGYVAERIGKTCVIHGTTGHWQLAIPNKGEEARPGDSRFEAKGELFIHQYFRSLKERMVDVYRSGNLVGTAGPFLRGFDDAELFRNGCISLTTGRREPEAKREVIVIGPDATIRLRQRCGEHDISPFVVANGKGVLLEVDGRPRPPVEFHYIGADGLNALLDLPANARCLCSDPLSDLVLFSINGTTDEGFQMLHATTGAVLWEIKSPVRSYPSTAIKTMIAGDKVLFLGMDLAAVNLKDGQLESFWREKRNQPMNGELFLMGNDVYVVCPSEFYKIDPSDLSKRHP